MRKAKTALTTALALAAFAACGPTPAELEITPERAVLDGAGSTLKLQAKVLDEEGNPITEGVDVTWFSTEMDIFDLDTTTGEIEAKASGEGEVEVEVVGTEIKTTVPVRVKIPGELQLSHEKSLSLWVGQVKDDVWAQVNSEKGAWIEGMKAEWSSLDPSIVKVENLVDDRRQAFVKLTALKSGNTRIVATFRNLTAELIVRVYAEDEEIALDGTRKKKKGADSSD